VNKLQKKDQNSLTQTAFHQHSLTPKAYHQQSITPTAIDCQHSIIPTADQSYS
jgi:hypothetical protein